MKQTMDSQTFKIRDAASYDDVTEQFDNFTERLSSPLAAKMVGLAEIAPNERILDIGTGTGVVALKAAQQIGAGAGTVTGIDLSEGMLRLANAKAMLLDLGEKAEFKRMDAEALEFKDAAFDAVLSLFALLHFPNPLAALKEIFRVLRPGGKLVLAIGSAPPLASLSGLAHRIGRLPDLLAKMQGKLLIAPGFLDGLAEQHFPEVREQEESNLASHSRNRTHSVPALVREAGFENLQTDWHGHQAVIEKPEEFWEIQRTFSSIARKRLGQTPPEKVEKLRQEFIIKCREVQSRGGRLVYPFAAFYVKAVKKGQL